mgnify:CR=1 FL=1
MSDETSEDTTTCLEILEENSLIVKWKKLHPRAVIPEYSHDGDSGCDLFCLEDTMLENDKITLVPTGLSVEIPTGYELQIRPRSGMTLKYGLIIPNSPGTVDSGYRGHIQIMMYPLLNNRFEIGEGDRIAQAVIIKVERPTFRVVEELSESDRGDGGFGSTGI